MATITGLTAARMLEIEASCIVDGAVLLDDLILTRHDGTTINAGNVRGAKGDPGDPGLKGDPGDPGPPGTAATITSVTAIGLATGSAPTVTAGGTASARTFQFGIPAGATGPAGADADVSMLSEASPSYQVGWEAWNDNVYRDLRFFMHADGWITLSGLARYVGGTGATTQICSLSSNWAPRDSRRDILSANVNDSTTPRWINVQASGIYLRGVVPTAVNQFISINGRYPGPLALL